MGLRKLPDDIFQADDGSRCEGCFLRQRKKSELEDISPTDNAAQTEADFSSNLKDSLMCSLGLRFLNGRFLIIMAKVKAFRRYDA